MKPSRYFTAGIYIGMVGALACLTACFITEDTDWLIMQLFFTCIYLNAFHCRKAAETNYRLDRLESVPLRMAPPIPDFDKLPRF